MVVLCVGRAIAAWSLVVQAAPPIAGGSGSPGASSAPAWPEFVRSAHGNVGVRAATYVRDRGVEKTNEQLFLEGELDLRLDFGRGLTGVAQPRFRVDALDDDLQRFEPWQAYLAWRDGPIEVAGGQMIETWKYTGCTNPLSFFNRRDFASDFVSPDRLGETMVRVTGSLADGATFKRTALSVYSLPVFRRTEFPTPDSRYSPETSTMGYDPDGGFVPSGDERLMWGARLATTVETSVATAELQLVGAVGPEHFPQLLVRPVGGKPTMMPCYFGAKTLGFGARLRPADSVFSFNAEAVLKEPYAFDGAPLPEPKNYFLAVFGPSARLRSVLADGDQLLATLEYCEEWGADDRTADIRIFQNDVAPRVAWTSEDVWATSVVARGLIDVESSERVFELTASRRLWASEKAPELTFRTQVFHLDRTQPSILDYFPDNTVVELGVRWRF